MSEELKKELESIPKYYNGSKAIPKDEIVVPYSAVISFLAKQQEEFEKMIGGLKYQPYDSTVDPFRQDGYNHCIADIKSKLNI
jgi:hypothetical protein